MAVNKVTYGGETLIDLTSDTVTANDLAAGVTATAADGTKVTGLLPKVEIDSALSSTSTNPVQNKVINTALAAKANTSDILVTVGDYTTITGKENLVVIDPDEDVDAYFSEQATVKSYADKAAESASSAKEYNDNITTTINTVTTKVNSAVSTAQAAQTSADSAVSTAQSANTTAQNAQTTAQSAQTTADSALAAVQTQVLMDMFYPIGSVYMTVSDTKPSFMAYGTWVEIASDKVLQGASSSHAAGSEIAAGLPNITGQLGVHWGLINKNKCNGAFHTDNANMLSATGDENEGLGSEICTFNASLSNSIYGNSSTVQPPAYVVHIYKRTA